VTKGDQIVDFLRRVRSPTVITDIAAALGDAEHRTLALVYQLIRQGRVTRAGHTKRDGHRCVLYTLPTEKGQPERVYLARNPLCPFDPHCGRGAWLGPKEAHPDGGSYDRQLTADEGCSCHGQISTRTDLKGSGSSS
jgi:hypothetical protein